MNPAGGGSCRRGRSRRPARARAPRISRTGKSAGCSANARGKTPGRGTRGAAFAADTARAGPARGGPAARPNGDENENGGSGSRGRTAGGELIPNASARTRGARKRGATNTKHFRRAARKRCSRHRGTLEILRAASAPRHCARAGHTPTLPAPGPARPARAEAPTPSGPTECGPRALAARAAPRNRAAGRPRRALRLASRRCAERWIRVVAPRAASAVTHTYPPAGALRGDRERRGGDSSARSTGQGRWRS